MERIEEEPYVRLIDGADKFRVAPEGVNEIVFERPSGDGANPLYVEANSVVAALCPDEGRTWRRIKDLETAKGEYCYPAVIQTRDDLM